MTPPILTTPRLILRPAAPSLAQAAAAYYRRNGAWLQPMEPFPETPLDDVRIQRRMMRQDCRMARLGQGVRFWIFRKEDPNTAIGCAALSNIVMGAFRSCFLSYKLDQRLLRRGYGSEAVLSVIQFAFAGLGLHRVEANIMPRNLPSLALAKKCGFTEEGRSPAYLQINGVWEEHIHMVRLATGQGGQACTTFPKS